MDNLVKRKGQDYAAKQQNIGTLQAEISALKTSIEKDERRIEELQRQCKNFGNKNDLDEQIRRSLSLVEEKEAQLSAARSALQIDPAIQVKRRQLESLRETHEHLQSEVRRLEQDQRTHITEKRERINLLASEVGGERYSQQKDDLQSRIKEEAKHNHVTGIVNAFKAQGKTESPLEVTLRDLERKKQEFDSLNRDIGDIRGSSDRDVARRLDEAKTQLKRSADELERANREVGERQARSEEPSKMSRIEEELNSLKGNLNRYQRNLMELIEASQECLKLKLKVGQFQVQVEFKNRLLATLNTDLACHQRDLSVAQDEKLALTSLLQVSSSETMELKRKAEDRFKKGKVSLEHRYEATISSINQRYQIQLEQIKSNFLSKIDDQPPPYQER